jgi:hypothetical protein
MLAGPTDSTYKAFLVPDLLVGPTNSTCEAFEMRTRGESSLLQRARFE